MAYEKTTWSTGDVVTAEKLNKMEDGIAGASAGGVFIVHSQVFNEGTYILDKTYTEIAEAMESSTVLVKHSGGQMGASQVQGIVLSSYQSSEYDPSRDTYYDIYQVAVSLMGTPYFYYTSSEDDYPICYNE